MMYRNEFPVSGIVRLPEVLEFIGLRRSTFLKLVKDRAIPITPIQLTGRTVGYDAIEVRDYVQSLIDAAHANAEGVDNAA